MKCKNCKRKATRYFESSHYLCDMCFAKVIENRLRRSVKGLGLKVNGTVNSRDVFAKYFVSDFIKFPVKMGKSNSIATSCLEEEILGKLQHLFYNKTINNGKRICKDIALGAYKVILQVPKKFLL